VAPDAEDIASRIGNGYLSKAKSIIIHSGRLVGLSVSNLLVEAGQIIGLAKDFLERKGIEIDSFGVPIHKPIFRFYTSEAEILSKHGIFYTSNGSVDCSDGVPHVEWNPETAKNYIEMPNRVKRIEKNIESISDNLLTFIKLIDRINQMHFLYPTHRENNKHWLSGTSSENNIDHTSYYSGKERELGEGR